MGGQKVVLYNSTVGVSSYFLLAVRNGSNLTVDEMGGEGGVRGKRDGSDRCPPVRRPPPPPLQMTEEAILM